MQIRRGEIKHRRYSWMEGMLPPMSRLLGTIVNDSGDDNLFVAEMQEVQL